MPSRKKRLALPEKARFHVSTAQSSAAPSEGSKTNRYSEKAKAVELRKNKPKNWFIYENGQVRFVE